ncbi:hypothetical protein TNCV_2594631 [Trichonephila clavipes]|nr:hypothetical protein TNCV_2594631 [Trichonephila clavipes]
MKEGLIASSYECPKCNEQMGLSEPKSVVLDGFEWRCRKKMSGFQQQLKALVQNQMRKLSLDIFPLRLEYVEFKKSKCNRNFFWNL